MRNTGVCKWFNPRKGFGFITRDDNNEDIFVHQTAIYADGFRSLGEGEKVEFDIEDNNSKTVAVNVSGPEGTYVKGGRKKTYEDKQQQYQSRPSLEKNLETAKKDLEAWETKNFNREKVKNRFDYLKREWEKNEVLRMDPGDRLLMELKNSVKYWTNKLSYSDEGNNDFKNENSGEN